MYTPIVFTGKSYLAQHMRIPQHKRFVCFWRGGLTRILLRKKFFYAGNVMRNFALNKIKLNKRITIYEIYCNHLSG
jgi:hypothetical protein